MYGTSKANVDVKGKHESGANSSEGERYYLRLLLNHVKGLKISFADLLSSNGERCSSFKDAAEKRGLIQLDNWISECLVKAASFQMPVALCRLFAMILVYCEPDDARKLWNDQFEAMSKKVHVVKFMKKQIASCPLISHLKINKSRNTRAQRSSEELQVAKGMPINPYSKINSY